MALPAFGGGSGPFGARRGEIVPAPPHEPRARAALATLYAALVTDLCLDLLQARGPLIIEGSFVGNPAFPRLLAALRRRRASSSPTCHRHGGGCRAPRKLARLAATRAPRS